MVLEVQTNTWQVDQRLNTSPAKLLGVTLIVVSSLSTTSRPIKLTDARALQDQWRAQSATANDDKLASSVRLRLLLIGAERLGRNGLDAGGALALENDSGRV
jgi:hypothetical protein